MSRSEQNIENSTARGSIRQQTDAGEATQRIRDSEAEDMQQVVESRLGGVDLGVLASELATLRVAMRDEPDSPDRDIAIGNIARAEKAAQEREPKKVAEYLKAAGRWAADLAEKVGIGVAVVAIKAAIGL